MKTWRRRYMITCPYCKNQFGLYRKLPGAETRGFLKPINEASTLSGIPESELRRLIKDGCPHYYTKLFKKRTPLFDMKLLENFLKQRCIQNAKARLKAKGESKEGETDAPA